MSTSRLINLLGSSIFHKIHSTPRFLPPIPPFRPIKPFLSPSLRFHRCCSSSSAAVLEDSANNYSPESSLNTALHPWPEWVAFVDRLKAKGYISTRTTGADEEEAETGGGSGDRAAYTDMNLLKDACLNFARDRYDLIRSLSRKQMQTLVGKRCPNLLRKAVNSAKRLRAYLGLDERDACRACILSGSCDRANLTLRESEGAARTVDVVRLLLLYALDPVVTFWGVNNEHREFAEASVRNLLSELTELSETISPPDLLEPSVKVTAEKKKSFSFARNNNTPDVEMKRGDWICSKCNFMNFSRNVKCRQCEDGPTATNAGDVEMKKGDWMCPKCNFMNFARNIRCLKCKTEGPKGVPANGIAMKEGDWNCLQCGFMNFSSNIRCLRCRDERPERELKPGDWECPSCHFRNFRRNISCKKCNHERPEELETRYGLMTWKKPFRRT